MHVFCTKSHFWTELSKFVILSKTPEKIQKLILGSLSKIKDNFLVGNTLCKDDILIICGDAGIIWDGMVNDA